MIRFVLFLWLLPLAAPAVAAPVHLEGDAIQGGLMRGRAAPGSEAWLDDKPVRVAADGRFVIGFGRDHGPRARLRVRAPGGGSHLRELGIEKHVYRIQRIDGLPPKMVTPSAEALKRIRRKAKLIRAVRRLDTPETWFASGFVWPAKGPITGVFGSQRVLNGEPRRPHYGIDIAAPAGTLVTAPAAGRVALAETDLYFTGGTVMVDHGHGVTSVFSHLRDVTARVGQILARGDPLGTIGASGRVTGPHLDWRVNWFAERLDPALLVGPMPE